MDKHKKKVIMRNILLFLFGIVLVITNKYIEPYDDYLAFTCYIGGLVAIIISILNVKEQCK